MKIMLATYSAATHTSYGKVTREIWRRVMDLRPNWSLYQQGWFHRTQQNLEAVPWPIEPTMAVRNSSGQMVPDERDIHGAASFAQAVGKFNPDVVWTLGDPYMMNHMGKLRATQGFQLIKYCPADGAPLPPPWRDAMKDCDLFVPLTKYAARAYQKWYDGDDLSKKVIYHGVNLEKFTPPSAELKEKFRPRHSWMSEKTFLLGFMGHNQYRKQTWNLHELMKHLLEGAYWVNLETGRVILDQLNDIDMSFEQVQDPNRGLNDVVWARPEPMDVALWMHCFKRGSSFDYPPRWLREYYGLGDRLFFSKAMGYYEGIPDEHVPRFFQSLDAYLSLSGGEGFCIPLIEAMACGVPTVYTDYSGQAEIGAQGGLPVRPLTVVREMKGLIGRAITDLSHAVEQIRKLYYDREFARTLGVRARKNMEASFSWDDIAMQWVDMIEKHCSPRRTNTLGVSL